MKEDAGGLGRNVVPNKYVPALRFPALTPWYDWTVAWSTRDAAMKARIVELASPQPGERVLDLGCGTGTLAIAMALASPGAAITGVDVDPAILKIALAKGLAAKVQTRFVPGWGHALPFPDASIDLAVSTLFFHHLLPDAKRRTLQELMRVLRPEGRLVIADFGRAEAIWRRGMFNLVRLLDGYRNTRDHAEGTLATFLLDAGFVDLHCLPPLAVPVGSIDFLVAVRAPN